MRYRSLGDSGLLVSVAGLGCNNFGGRLDVEQTRAVVDAAIDAGITLFDTADIYGSAGGSEEMLGAVLGARRDQIVLATKFGHQRVDMGYGPAAGAKGGRAYIRRAVEHSLRLAPHRLPRPVPAAHARPGHAHRRDPARAGRAGRRGQGPLPRPLQLPWLADRRCGPRGAGGRRGGVHLRPEPAGRCSSARPRPRSCPRPCTSVSGCCRTRRSRTACSPGRSGAARRRRPAAGWPAARATSPSRSSTGWRRSSAGPPGTGSSLLDVAIGGLAAQPGCASVIAGATSPDQVKANAAAAEWIPPQDALAGLDQIVPPPGPAS